MLRTVEFSKAGLVWGVRNKFVAAIDKPRIGALPRKVGIPPLHASQKAEHRRRRSSEEPNVDVEKRSALLGRHRSTDLVKPARAAHRWRRVTPLCSARRARVELPAGTWYVNMEVLGPQLLFRTDDNAAAPLHEPVGAEELAQLL